MTTNAEIKGRLVAAVNATDTRTLDHLLRGVTKAAAQREYQPNHPMYPATWEKCAKYLQRKNPTYEGFCQSLKSHGSRCSSPLAKRIRADVWRELTSSIGRDQGRAQPPLTPQKPKPGTAVPVP